MFKNKRTVHIEWGDCDSAQIVFYPRYFAFFDSSTQYLFEAAGYPKKRIVKEFGVIGFPMVDTRAKFYIPSTYGDDIDIVSTVTEFRNSSFDVHHQVFKGDKLALEGFETRVLVGPHPDKPGALKSCAIPKEIVERFSRDS